MRLVKRWRFFKMSIVKYKTFTENCRRKYKLNSLRAFKKQSLMNTPPLNKLIAFKSKSITKYNLVFLMQQILKLNNYFRRKKN